LTMEAISDPNVDESTKIVAAVATVTSVAAVAVIARLYVRISMIRSFGWDVSGFFCRWMAFATDTGVRTP
jgi:hypothetical protein